MKIRNYFTFITACLTVVSLNAQDYILKFSASGASSTVSSVKIENITRGTTITVEGTDEVRLSSSVTSIRSYDELINSGVNFIPNPMQDLTRMQFNLPGGGFTAISVYDISGRKITEFRDFLSEGQHSFKISDLNRGIYFISLRSDKYSSSGRLISAGSGGNRPEISIDDGIIFPYLQKDGSKGVAEETKMLFINGDILKLTGKSGSYSTVITDSPATDKTINFNFIECRDGSGNNYSVVMIGSSKNETDISDDKGVQIWMGENLMTTILNDGTAINNVTGNNTWSQLSSPAYCWYDNIINDYGMLYNWHAVGTGKLCPSGWRVPSDDDWSLLVQYLGGATTAGGKLKETGTIHWNNPTGSTNSSGFTALPGGYRLNTDGSFGDLTASGWWWASTPSNISSACYRTILSTGSPIYGFMSEADKKFGFSVRCIKNDL